MESIIDGIRKVMKTISYQGKNQKFHPTGPEFISMRAVFVSTRSILVSSERS